MALVEIGLLEFVEIDTGEDLRVRKNVALQFGIDFGSRRAFAATAERGKSKQDGEKRANGKAH